MGKNDFLTPKAIANRIKAKGLQKLRWYCQMCQKQCRDENGFKCHLSSESHKRQMELFGQNPDRVIEGYSEEFERNFMEHLKRSHPFSRVLAKNIYNEFIADRNHVHMNSTIWYTLTEFVKYLGKTGKCKVEETEKGWYITLIQSDPMKELDGQKRLKRDRSERAEEDRQQRELEAQIERAQKLKRTDEETDHEPKELVRGEFEEPLKLALPSAKHALAMNEPVARPKAPVSFEGDDDDDRAGRGASTSTSGKSKPKLKYVELAEKEKARAKAKALAAAAREQQQPHVWIHRGIIVKVLSKALKEHGYYKQKGEVLKVITKDKRVVAEIEMLDSGDVLQVDQAELETVIPQPGGHVLLVSGAHTGATGKLAAVDTDKFQAQVELLDGKLKGKRVWFEYEDICKLASS